MWDEQRKSDVSTACVLCRADAEAGAALLLARAGERCCGELFAVERNPLVRGRPARRQRLGRSPVDRLEELPDSLRVVPGQEFNKIRSAQENGAQPAAAVPREVKVTKPVERATAMSAAWDSSSCF